MELFDLKSNEILKGSFNSLTIKICECGGVLKNQKYMSYCINCNRRKPRKVYVAEYLDNDTYLKFIGLVQFTDGLLTNGIIKSFNKDFVLLDTMGGLAYGSLPSYFWWIKKGIGRGRIERDMGILFTMRFDKRSKIHLLDWNDISKMLYLYHDGKNERNRITIK